MKICGPAAEAPPNCWKPIPPFGKLKETSSWGMLGISSPSMGCTHLGRIVPILAASLHGCKAQRSLDNGVGHIARSCCEAGAHRFQQIPIFTAPARSMQHLQAWMAPSHPGVPKTSVLECFMGCVMGGSRILKPTSSISL